MEVLSQTDVNEFTGNILAIIAFFVLTAIMILLVAITIFAADEGEGAGALAVLGLALIFGLLSWATYGPATEAHTEYRVTIDDFNEVHDAGYEIIDQEGDIYTVTKK